MIRAISWFCADHCGALTPGSQSFSKTSPQVTSSNEMLALIGRPVKYFPRMTRESRSCLAAASIALEVCGWKDTEFREIGLLAAGYEACLAADQVYFSDYVAGGRSLGRGNLFIYTLPSSTMGEIAIALGLRGPAVHIHDAHHPAQILIRHARRLLEDGEADGILALWSDSKAAVCFAVDGGAEHVNLSSLEWDQHPHEMAHALATMVQPT